MPLFIPSPSQSSSASMHDQLTNPYQYHDMSSPFNPSLSRSNHIFNVCRSRDAYRTADRRLVPSVFTCQMGGYLLVFGIFLLLGGALFRFIAGSDAPPSPEFDTEFFNKNRKEFASTPRTIGLVMILIGSTFISIAFILIAYAWITYSRYEKMRRRELNSVNTIENEILSHSQITNSTLESNSGQSNLNQIGFQYQPGYQPLFQGNMNSVYYPTTEPLVNINGNHNGRFDQSFDSSVGFVNSHAIESESGNVNANISGEDNTLLNTNGVKNQEDKI